ncbi:cytochrome d ubiquinol oxidase subunit II [Schaalia sp. ZJ405]|uniref:cytochrome d ubiquinol oxidase subunit II n=1 Tax=unclassified Schaalia TaxID=2691889 RepID=UPI0013EBFF09|nr:MULTISPECIES: cytochrome d ubiquinol oxidase subunit II [unclassified Schaalia]QPK81903.1 cytochrome d ubiquinol oxidase subunit II [Schaalia sp. ZJ405]
MDWTFFQILWFILIAVLWTVFLVLEGFDFGVGMLLPFVAKNDAERTQATRTIGPHWDGNEVWLLTAGGATFAAFPEWYATMFSGMYLALFLVLVALILRISALEWRSKLATAKWRGIWDGIHTVCAYLVPLLLGVAFANLVHGMAIEVVDGVHQLTGGFFSLLNLYTLLGGVVVLAVCFAHGAQFLSLKTEGAVRERANAISGPASIVATVLAAVLLVWGQFVYTSNVLAWIPLVIAALAIIASAAFSQPALRSEGKAFVFSSVAIAATVAWIFSAMAPAVMKSSLDPAASLTIAQASSTQSTLQVMTIVALCFVPVVLAYTIWSYWVFRKRVSVNDIDENAGLLPGKIRLDKNFLVG